MLSKETASRIHRRKWNGLKRLALNVSGPGGLLPVEVGNRWTKMPIRGDLGLDDEDDA